MQVCVHQQHFFTLTGQRQCEIGGYSGLAFILCHACDQYHFPLVALGGMGHFGSQFFNLFCEVETGGRHSDQQARLAALQAGTQGLVFFFVVDGGKQPGIHFMAHGVSGLHCIRQYCHGQQSQHHACRADEKGALGRTAQMQGVGGRTGYRGRIQLTQHHVLKHMLGHRIIVIQPESQCTER